MFSVEERLAKICAAAFRFGKVEATFGVKATGGLRGVSYPSLKSSRIKFEGDT